MCDPPTIKRKRGKVLHSGEKQMVVNIYNYLKGKNPGKPVQWIADETAAAVGVSSTTVFATRREAASGTIKTPNKKRKSRCIRVNSREAKYDDFVRSAIRRKVHSFYMKNVPPTLKSILAAVNSDNDLPNFKKSSFHLLLKEMGFTYSKRGNRALLIEREDIISWRHRYLYQIKKFRNEKRNIVYTDESWINAGTSVNKEWQDTTVKTSRQAFMSGLSCGLKAPTSRVRVSLLCTRAMNMVS